MSTEKHTQNWIARTADFLLDHAIAGLVVTALLTVSCVYGLTQLQSGFGFRIWFSEDDPYLKAYDRFESEFGNDDNVVVVVHSPSGLFDDESIRLLHEITDRMWKIQDVIRVDSLSSYPLVQSRNDEIAIEPLFPKRPAGESYSWELLTRRKEAVKKDPTLINYLVSEDLKTAVVYGQLKPLFDGRMEYRQTVADVYKMLEAFRGRGDHTFHVTGTAAISAAFQEVSVGDLKRLTPVILALVLILLYFSFRSAGGIFLTLVPLAATIGMTFGIAGWLGYKFNTMTAALPQILIAINLADAIHLLSTFFRLRNQGESKREAARQSIITNFVPTLLTSVTTGLGFLSFWSSSLAPIRELGILATIGVMIAWLITIAVLPAALLYFPSKPRADHQERQLKRKTWLRAYLIGIEKWRWAVIGSWTVVAVASVFIGLRNEVNSDLLNYFSDSVPLKAANRFMEDHVGGARGVEILVDAGAVDGVKRVEFLERVERLQEWIKENPKVTKVTSLVDIVKDVNQAMENDDEAQFRLPVNGETVAQQLFLYGMSVPQGMDLNYWSSMDARKMRVKVLWKVSSSKEILADIKAIEAKAAALGLSAAITGKTSLMPGMNDYIVNTVISSDLQSLLFVTLAMMLIFGSFKIGLISMVPNVIPPLMGTAIMVLVGINYDVGTVMVMSVVMGIAVDDTIHFFSHFAEKHGAGQTTFSAILEVLEEAGFSIVLTTVILVVGFGVFAFGRFIPSVNFGIMTAIALGLAVTADLVLAPAILMVVFKRKVQASPETTSSVIDANAA